MKEKQTLFSYLYRHLREQIFSGYLKNGSALPSINRLSDTYNIGIRTVKDVLVALKKDGLIKTGERKPTIVTYLPCSSGPDINATESVLRNKSSVNDIFETMALLMPRIFSLSIQNYNGEKLNYYIRMFRSYKNKTPDDLWSVCSLLLHDILHESPNLLFESLYVDLLIYAKSSFFTEHRRALSGFYSYSEGHIATSVIESIATKDPAEVFSCFQWMYDTACASIKRYMDDLSVKKPGIPEDNPCEFLWKAEKGRDHYYTQVARDIIDKIGSGIYDEGTFLPSESRLASHYGVSVATIRKALAMVNHLGFAQTFNVKGTQVMLQGDGNAANSMKNKVYKKDTLSYLSGLQLMAIAIRPAALMVFDRLDDSIKQSLSTQPAVPGRNRLDLIVECIIERLHLYPLRDILKETKKMLLWGYYYAFFIENPKLVDTLDDKVLAAVGYLQKGEKANFADQLSLYYLHVLEFVRGFVVGYGLSEAAKLTAT